MKLLKFFKRVAGLIVLMGFNANFAVAASEDGQYLPYSGPTVEDNVTLMDTDKNGFADVHEVRAFLQLKHGKEYEREMLDRWEATSTSKSCGSSFSKSLYQ